MKLIKQIKDNQIIECLPLVLLTFSLPSLMYNFLNDWHGPVNYLVTDLDRVLPFLKIFIIPYLSWYPFFALSILLLACYDKKMFHQTLVSINIAEGACFLIYFLYQTTVPRPVPAGNDVLSLLVTMVYQNDQPVNCFPSIHVLTTYLFLKGIYHLPLNRAGKGILNATGVLIILSTVFIKQHVVIDVFSAIILAEAIYWLVEFLQQKNIISWLRYSHLLGKDKKIRKYI